MNETSVPATERVEPARAAPFRMAWLMLGIVSLGLGTVGVVLPLLPTTPFVILAACAFARSSPTLRHRLESNRVFGPVIADWSADRRIAPRYKVLALSMMVIALGLSILTAFPVPVLVVQVACMTAAATFILKCPS